MIGAAGQQQRGDQAHQPEAAGEMQPARDHAEAGHSGDDGLRESRITMITTSTPAARVSAPASSPTVSGLKPSGRSGPP